MNIARFLNDAERAKAVPSHVAQLGVQTDKASLWVATGETAGAWQHILPPTVNDDSTATAPTLATAGTIATTKGQSRVTTAGAVTGVILAAGTVHGQQVVVVNESANSITFAASGTSNVADGVSDVIAATNARTFVWNGKTALWYPHK